MASYRATIDWSLEDGADFAKGRYSRAHTVTFQQHVMPATASAHVVGKWAAPGAVDPEEMFVAALSNCHMGGLGTTLVQGVNASSTVNGSCHGAMVCAGLPTRVNG